MIIEENKNNKLILSRNFLKFFVENKMYESLLGKRYRGKKYKNNPTKHFSNFKTFKLQNIICLNICLIVIQNNKNKTK